MKKNIFLLTLLLTFLVSSSAKLSATHLDGLWRNDRQNITIRIEQDQDGFRAKRTDQGIWYQYTLDDNNIYVDKRGNWYEVIDEDQIEWTEIVSRKRIVFNRVESRNSDTWTGRDREDENRDSDYDRGNREVFNNRAGALTGRWYAKSSKERLIIEEINNGFRVRTLHGDWEKFTSDRNGQRLRSRSGDIIQMMDRNTLRYKNRQDNYERVFVRQGNVPARGNGYEQERGNSQGRGHGKDHDKNKHCSAGKNHCG